MPTGREQARAAAATAGAGAVLRLLWWLREACAALHRACAGVVCAGARLVASAGAYGPFKKSTKSKCNNWQLKELEREPLTPDLKKDTDEADADPRREVVPLEADDADADTRLQAVPLEADDADADTRLQAVPLDADADNDADLRRQAMVLDDDADSDIVSRHRLLDTESDTAGWATVLLTTNAGVASGSEQSSLQADDRIIDTNEPEELEYIANSTEAAMSPRDACASGDGGVVAEVRQFAATGDDSSSVDLDTDDMRLEFGRGVSVVRACGRDAGGERFELDEAALAQLLLRPGVAERPVALVSVAGAFRGGKSFLLDFFLRYLYAEESARVDGSWLGAPEEPLRGFSWRGGCQRETTGLVLWSQPFPVTLPSGEKVVVLLMDTQGSFDDKSTMRDCSLIFALSTLLSSVQVYNLSQRINENDLQHLQLFTEHAAAGGGALQTLQLVVRDWSAPADFPYGVAGGADYLSHKLQVHAEQPLELREVRERLASSFERVECCLLPHPGLPAAADPAFAGQLADMTEDFKASLRELVPLLLEPARLRVKEVDGRVLRARELALHLRVYLDTFRLHVPSPQSIVRAQAAARWLAAAAAARARLRAHAPARAAPARARAELHACLAAARRAVIESIAELAVRAGDEEGLANLEKDLGEQMAQYIDLNEKKIALAVAAANKEWEQLTRELREPALCAPAPERELREDVAGARADAVATFDRQVADPEGPERAQLVQDLERRGAVLLLSACATSERNHRAAARAALAALRSALPPRCLHPADLAADHAAAAAAARAAALAKRTRPARHQPDPHFTRLDEEITLILRDDEERNTRVNEQAVTVAQTLYDATMKLDEQCRHPADLAATHARAAQRAAAELLQRRSGSGAHAADRSDVFSQQLEQWIRDRYDVYNHTNSRNSEAAVETAFGVFCTRMQEFRIVQRTAVELDLELADADTAAKEAFMSKRLSQMQLGIDDVYFNQLEQKIRDRYEHYRQVNGQRITRAGLAGAIVAAVAGVAVVSGGAVAAAVAPEATLAAVGAVLTVIRNLR